MSVFPPWRVAQRRGRFLAALIVSRPFTTSPRTPRHPRTQRFLAARIEIVSSVPREKARLAAIRDVFLRWTLERRTSLRREPFRLSERAVSQRTSIPWALPPWSDDMSPFARGKRVSLELVPAGESSAACLTDDRRKRRFFEPRHSDRILQHETDARARPYGLLCSSPARDRLSRRRSRSHRSRGNHVESRVDLRNRLDESSRTHPPCANASRDCVGALGSGLGKTETPYVRNRR